MSEARGLSSSHCSLMYEFPNFHLTCDLSQPLQKHLQRVREDDEVLQQHLTWREVSRRFRLTVNVVIDVTHKEQTHFVFPLR